MALWTYRCYDDGGAPNLWTRWYDQHPEMQGSHDSVFRMLEAQPQWNNTVYTKTLPGKVIEVRLSGPIQWRVMGHYGNAQREFVVTDIGYHKGARDTPKGLKGNAALHRKLIKAGAANAHVCNRPG